MYSDQQVFREIAREAWEFGVGLTPLLPIRVSDSMTVYAKLESFNRFKSVKDRAAFFMIGMARRAGILDKSKTLIEASSGNTGIAIASIATALGYDAEIYVPETSSEETRNVLKKTGAKIMEVSDENSRLGKINIDGALKLVHQRLLEEPEKYVNLDQYGNVANTLAHVYTTGPEIISALDKREAAPDVFVTGVGTGGTVTGMATFLKTLGGGCTVCGVEPEQNHHIQGLKNLSVSRIPEILSSRMDMIDRWMTVDDTTAYDGVRKITGYGYFAGISSGANFTGAMRIASEMKHGNIVTVFPDSAEKYRSVMISGGIFSEFEYDRLSDEFLSVPEDAILLSRERMLRDA